MIAIDMEMPKNCAECQFGCITYNNNRKCKISESCYTVIFTSKERPSDCPLKEIITCKDCKNYLHIDGHDHLDYCDQHGCVSSNHYCADAERKE